MELIAALNPASLWQMPTCVANASDSPAMNQDILLLFVCQVFVGVLFTLFSKSRFSIFHVLLHVLLGFKLALHTF